jgi:tyrosyl-tRNA synthetase
MDLAERLYLITKAPTEEVITTDELKSLLETIDHPKHYIGLEISGLLHLGSLVLTGFKINDFIKAQVHSTVFLADWHSYINNKLDGSWEKIQSASKYYSDAFKFFCPGVNIMLGSELYNNTYDYWQNFVHIAKRMTLQRTLRSLTIMGRHEREDLDFAQLLYPPMQAADIKALEVDIVHAGMDQRKIHMLVREIFPKLRWKVPTSVHHHLLPGLSEPSGLGLSTSRSEDVRISSKMSKTKPASSITIHDDETIIKSKVNKAFCPVGKVEGNPILELIKFIVFHEFTEFNVERPAKFGGDVTYASYEEVENDYLKNKIHPMDIKNATAYYINKVIEPVRMHFRGKEPNLDRL